MSKRESISRCNLIVKKLRKQPATFNEIADYLESLNFKVYLIAQFAIDANGKSFSVSYLGTGHNGQSYGHSIELSYRDILKNDLFSVFPPDMPASKDFAPVKS